jgi:hypothetical protein
MSFCFLIGMKDDMVNVFSFRSPQNVRIELKNLKNIYCLIRSDNRLLIIHSLKRNITYLHFRTFLSDSVGKSVVGGLLSVEAQGSKKV